MKPLSLLLGCLLLAACQDYNVAQLKDIPPDVKKSVQAAVNKKHRPGVVIGLVNSAGTYYYSYGVLRAGTHTPLSEQSQFAIGSLTKLFTAELLERYEQQGVITKDTLVSDIWPKVEDNGDTRLIHLATHTASLPRNLDSATLTENSSKRLLKELSRQANLPAENKYSSVGMAILGLSLGKVSNLAFEVALQRAVLDPLNLAHTSYTPDEKLLATRHQITTPVETSTDTPAVAYGAGGLYTTATDLMRFLKSQMEQQRTLGWKRYTNETFTAYYHGGDGNGHQSFVAFRPDNSVGVVLLSNSSADDALQDIALHLIDPRINLPLFEHPPYQRLNEDNLAKFAGDYRLIEDSDGNRITLTVINHQLIYHEKTSNGETVRKSPLYAIDAHTFQLADVPVTVSFNPQHEKPDATLSFNKQVFTMVKVE